MSKQQTATTIDFVTGADRTGPVGTVRLSRGASGLEVSIDGAAPAAIGGGGDGTVESVVEGSNINVDATDPANPVVSVLPDINISTLLSASDTITLSGLNGDVDGEYQFDAELLINSASPTVSFKPQSQASNLLAVTGSFLQGSVNHTDWILGRVSSDPWTFASGDKLYITGSLRAATGRIRMLSMSGFFDLSTNNELVFSGIWTDTTTNLTSFQILGNQASAFAAGSWLRMVPKNIVG
jgi:hypothetical protein